MVQQVCTHAHAMRPRVRVQDVALVAMSLHAFAPAQLSAIGCGSLFLFAARPR